MGRPVVLVTRLIPSEGLGLLRQHAAVTVNPHDRPYTREEFLEAAAPCDGIVCMLTDRIDRELLARAPRLRGVANVAVGYDNVDLAAATARGVAVSNTPDVLTNATAEMAWALLFAAARRVVESDTCVRTGCWSGWGPLQFVGADIAGATLGIVGAGRIGTAMALRSRGFDMRVLYADTMANERLERECGARRVVFDDLLAQSDFVSIHCPLSAATRHLFGRDAFARMKPGAILVNTARGAIVDEPALVEALARGQIAGVGLDVYEREPSLAPGLSECRNVVLTAHTASATVSSRTAMAVRAAQNMLAMLQDRPAPDCLNPQRPCAEPAAWPEAAPAPSAPM